MTTKILTIRVPAPIYSQLCANAAELGVPISAHVRRLIETEYQAEQVAQLRTELLARLNTLASSVHPTALSSPAVDEILLLARATAAHLNPQLVAQVRSKLAAQLPGAAT